MTWNIKENHCSDGVIYSSNAPRVYHIDPSVRIETSRQLTAEERRRVIDALVADGRELQGGQMQVRRIIERLVEWAHEQLGGCGR